MTGFRTRILLVIAATLSLGAVAWAEAIFPINDTTLALGVFDQPAVVADGNTIHVAFVGDNTGTYSTNPSTKLYYAAVNGAADFASSTTTRPQVVVTPPVAIDNIPLPYANARHPRIALRSPNKPVILFQAIPSGDTRYKLFRALLTLDNNAVVAHRVDEITDNSVVMSGSLVDPSFAVATTDNTARVAYADNTTGNVYYARVGLDNAFLVGASPILLTKPTDPRGANPRPRLAMEGTTRSHIVWAVDNTSSILSQIYYAMVKDSATAVDNLAIGASQVLSGGYRWVFPTVHVPSASRVLVFAADEPVATEGTGRAGPLGFAVLNPDAVTQDGNPVNPLSHASFILSPPGNAVITGSFNVYRPETVLDSQNFVHVAGYGFLSSSTPPYFGTSGMLYSMSISGLTTNAGTSLGSAGMTSSPNPIGMGNIAFATTIPGDYTRTAFAHFSGKAVLLWSGVDNVTPGARNLYVTSALDSTDPPVPTKQSGCAMVAAGEPGETGRIPGAAVLLLPAALLALRRATRKAFGR